MVEVRWTDQAITDIANIAEYIAQDSEKYAFIQTERFFDRTEILESLPYAGRMVPELMKKSIRELILGNYRIVYRIASKSRVDVVAVHHSARLLKPLLRGRIR